MAWKRVFYYEGDEAAQAIAHACMEVIVGPKYRVTVEEEVNACCEKWRGQFACLMRSGVVVSGANCRFCPECGRRL